MSYIIKKPYVEPHLCKKPFIPFGARYVVAHGPEEKLGVGTIWKCDECPTTWVLAHDDKDSPSVHWIEVGKATLGWAGIV